MAGSIRKLLTAPDLGSTSFEALGYDTKHAPARTQLEASARQFIIGYEFGIEQRDHEGLVARLESLQREYRGFAYEGATMALSMRDVMNPLTGKKRTETFLAGPGYDDGPGSRHIFMAYIGLGFALARLPGPMWKRALPRQSKLPDHPSLRGLILDGYGFHQAFFHHKKWVDGQYAPPRYRWPGPHTVTQRVVDQGVGRAMWFVYGGDVERLLEAIERFGPERRADLMSGAGLAATYAGGVEEEALDLLWAKAGQYRPDVAQGAVFALRARDVADLVTPGNEAAAQRFCGLTAAEASQITVEVADSLPQDSSLTTYEEFRRRVRIRFQ
jgi:enediyne biosynthesis protein E2